VTTLFWARLAFLAVLLLVAAALAGLAFAKGDRSDPGDRGKR
jgi:hypothetical protein